MQAKRGNPKTIMLETPLSSNLPKPVLLLLRQKPSPNKSFNLNLNLNLSPSRSLNLSMGLSPTPLMLNPNPNPNTRNSLSPNLLLVRNIQANTRRVSLKPTTSTSMKSA